MPPPIPPPRFRYLPGILERLPPRTCRPECDRPDVLARGDRDFSLIARDLAAERSRDRGRAAPVGSTQPQSIRAWNSVSVRPDKTASADVWCTGWDVRNVTTIVPLRPLSAQSKILPEQTLGRGLRRMTPSGAGQAGLEPGLSSSRVRNLTLRNHFEHSQTDTNNASSCRPLSEFNASRAALCQPILPIWVT